MSDFLTVVEVLAMHADQIERYGGSASVRDPGLLEAAIYRPQTGHYADLIEEAAALWESLSMYTFLTINGARLSAGAEATYTSRLYAANQFNFDKLVPWLRKYVKAV